MPFSEQTDKLCQIHMEKYHSALKKLAMPSKPTKEQAPIPNPEATSIDNYM